jgi:hypothetical protein
VTDRQDDTGLHAGLCCASSIRCRQREGLFDKHVLAGTGGHADVLPVLRMRRCQYDRVNSRIGENLLI